MAIIQYSKIQLRRGAEVELPGAPITTSPIVFSNGLDVSEMGFAEDSGRLFIGHEPTTGHGNFARLTFPYQNIEVLTENSTERLATIFDQHYRDTATGYFASIALSPNSASNPNDWSTIQTLVSGAPVTFRLNDAGTVTSAQIAYTAVSGASPIRRGTMTVTHNGGASAPSLIDECVAYRRTDISLTDVEANPALAYDTVRFRAIVVGSGSTAYVALQCRNMATGAIKVLFRIERQRL